MSRSIIIDLPPFGQVMATDMETEIAVMFGQQTKYGFMFDHYVMTPGDGLRNADGLDAAAVREFAQREATNFLISGAETVTIK